MTSLPALISALVIAALPIHAAEQTLVERIDEVARFYHEHGMLNGVVLVKQGGETVYHEAFGIADPADGRPVDLDTRFLLASVSKQFTAMAVMLLVEGGELDWDTEVASIVPELSEQLDGVTVHHLLTHTSGLPDYLNDLGLHRPGMTNEDVLAILAEHGTPRFAPGEQASYSNSGYVLLSVVVERISGKPLGAFLAESVFTPLDMNASVLRDRPMTIENCAQGFELSGAVTEHCCYTTGPGGLYSTAGDLARWDAALAANQLVSEATLQRAFTDNSLPSGQPTTFGYGWRVRQTPAGKRVFHVGGNKAYTAYIQRDLETGNALVVLSNSRDSEPAIAAMAIDDVLAGGNPFVDGRPGPQRPRVKLAPYLGKLVRDDGLEATLARLGEIDERERDDFDMGEGQLNLLGYIFLQDDQVDTALPFFEWNARLHPDSANVHDSLGEALEAAGRNDEAMAAYERSLERNPDNSNASERLAALGARG